MKKTSLYSFAALMAAVCLPAQSLVQSVYALPDGSAVKELQADPAVLSADQFIELFCGVTIQRVMPDGTPTAEFIWYTAATPENCQTIAAGKAVFDQMDAARQEIIIQAARAFSVDYLSLAAAAQAMAAPAAPAAPVPAEEELTAQPVQDSSASSQSSEASESTQSADSSASEDSAALSQSSEASSSSASETSDQNSSQSSEQASEDSGESSQNSESEKPAGKEEDSGKSDKEDSGKENSGREDSASEDSSKEDSDKDSSQSSADDSSVKSEEEKPAADANASSDSASSTTSDAAQAEEEKNQQTSDEENPAASDDQNVQDNNADVQDPAETQPERPVYDYAGGNLNLLPAHQPKGLVCTELMDTPVDEQTFAVAQAIAQGAGWPAHMVIPVVYTYTGNGVSVSSGMLYRVSINELMILFSYAPAEDGSIVVTIYTDGSCSYDSTAGILSLPAIGQAVLQPQSVDAIQNEMAEINPSQDPGMGAGTEKSLQTSPVQSQLTENEPIAQLNTENEQAIRETLLRSPVLPALDSTAQDFVNLYCMQNGAVIKSIDASNYQQVLNGMKAWNAMNTTQRRAVNDYLAANGSTRFQTLYKQANEYRLGMPLRQETLAGSSSTAGRVNTGVAEDLLMAMGSFTLSAQALTVLGLYSLSKKKYGFDESDKDE